MVIDDLDRRSKRVLEAVWEHGGEAETGEIKEHTGIEENNIILYRVKEKLAPLGLVEHRKEDRGDGSLGVRVTTLTEKGREVVGHVVDDGATGPTLSEHVQILRGEVEDLADDVALFEGRLHEVEEDGATVEEMEARLASLERRFEEVEAVAEDLERLRDDLTGRVEEAVEEELTRRRFLGVDLAVALHEAGLIEPAEAAGVDGSQGFDRFGGTVTGPSDRLIAPSPELRERMGDAARMFPAPEAFDGGVDDGEEVDGDTDDPEVELRSRDDTHRAYNPEEVVEVVRRNGGEATVEEIAAALHTTEDVVGQLVFNLEQENIDIERETRTEFGDDGEAFDRREVVVDHRVDGGAEGSA